MSTDVNEQTTENWMKEAQKGYIRIAVLILLSKKPSHGYEIMKEIKDKSRGFYTPTSGGVYPILRDLEKSGYIEGGWHTQNNRKIKSYRITEQGLLILRKAVVKQTEIANNINSLFQEFARDVLNVETVGIQTPVMPNPFAPFLQKENLNNADIKELERQRKELGQHAKMIQEKLKTIDKELERAKTKK
jgi:DNA-binding PadR family transcriptional regulator